jgi:Na+/H+-dicarboxylate symporter
MSSTSRVLIGVGAGLGLGIAIASAASPAATRMASIVEPIGILWLRALQMTVVPLVVSLLVTGVSTAHDAAATGRLAARALAIFAVLLTSAALFAAVVAPAAYSLWPADAEHAAALGASALPAEGTEVPSLSDWVSGIVPSNPIRAAADGAILPLVVFALFFGLAVTRIEADRRRRLVELFQSIVDAMMVIVSWILWAAPVGVFALALPIGATLGVGVLGAVASFVIVTSAISVAITLALYPVAVVLGRVSIGRFARAIAPAQTVAFSTQSSLASLPAMLEGAELRLGLPSRLTSFVLPLAVSLFRVTSPAAYISAAGFAAWLYGVDLSVAQLLTGVAVGVVVSLGAVSLPNQVSFMGSHMPVLQAMGLPLEPLGLMLAVSSIPDLFMTVGNVTADVTAASVVARGGGPLPPLPRGGAMKKSLNRGKEAAY